MELDKTEAVKDTVGSESLIANVLKTLGFRLVLTVIVSLHAWAAAGV